MAPMTRNRAGPGNVPQAPAIAYYGQRASAGLIISEATQVIAEGQGYQATPGIHSAEQIAGWKKVTQAVHDRGGKIFCQLWHVGRVSHVALQPGGKAPVAPSALRAKSRVFVDGAFVEPSEPRALRLDEIPGVIEAFRRGAANAIAAGFDGVEVHGANGYLLDQFLRDGANKRDDSYGGSIENRARLTLEVTTAVIDQVGAERTGIRLSPVTPSNDMTDSNPQPVFNYVVERLDALKPVYIHIVEGAGQGDRAFLEFDYGALRRRFHGAYIANNNYTLEMAEEALADKHADLIAFGRPFIANPDFVRRISIGAALSDFDKTKLYGGNAEGYSDYPALEPV
jgi:N-ethylmaleimide reductase